MHLLQRSGLHVMLLWCGLVRGAWFGRVVSSSARTKQPLADNAGHLPESDHFWPDSPFLDMRNNQETESHLSREERLALEHASGAVSKYQRRDDGCFKAAVANLKAGCSELQLEDVDKIRYAVHLTRCEIATANIPIPLECTGDHLDVNVYSCVQTLSHVPQLWTSYSGYVREVSSMCFAIRYETTRDYIENLFHNVTRAQIAGLKLLRYQQADLRKYHTEELAHIKVVRDAQNDLLEESANIKTLAQHAVAFANSLDDNLRSSIDKMSTLFESQEKTEHAMDNALSRADSLSNVVVERFTDTLKAMNGIEGAVARLAEGISTLVENEGVASQALADLQMKVQEFGTNLAQSSGSVSNSINDISRRIDTANTKFDQLSAQQMEALRQMAGAVEFMFQENMSQFGAVLGALLELNATSLAVLGAQSEVMTNLKDSQIQQQLLAHQWAESFARAEANLDSLSVRSSQQIELLMDATAAASTRHQEVLQLISPLAWLADVLNGELQVAASFLAFCLLQAASMTISGLSAARLVKFRIRIGSSIWVRSMRDYDGANVYGAELCWAPCGFSSIINASNAMDVCYFRKVDEIATFSHRQPRSQRSHCQPGSGEKLANFFCRDTAAKHFTEPRNFAYRTSAYAPTVSAQ
ncbi:hypothetical protein BC832DRAFT_603752 [Gaertneriomyces semiglobifer]|nr:hypothetical protein BC832DRAFT_603752 [Gaertneriomyces semiglobifer]